MTLEGGLNDWEKEGSAAGEKTRMKFAEEIGGMIGTTPDLERIKVVVSRFVEDLGKKIDPDHLYNAATEIFDDLNCGAIVAGGESLAARYVFAAIAGERVS